LPEWEQLREVASGIKNYVLSHMDDLLISFEEKAKENGVHVHWAANAAEHNEIVLGLLKRHKIDKMVKSKSMLTEECHMNEFLTEMVSR
jgi:L-lactate dehydrogenase complex protein LldF